MAAPVCVLRVALGSNGPGASPIRLREHRRAQLFFPVARSYLEATVSRSAGAGMGVLSRSSLWFLLYFLAAGVPGSATPPTAAPFAAPTAGTRNPERAYAELSSFVQEQIEALGIPGAAIFVVPDEVQLHAAALAAPMTSDGQMTAQTPVLLASTSKTVTAIAVMQQVEAGRLRLDEPVQTYLPWFTMDDTRSSAITVRPLAPSGQRHGLDGHDLRSIRRAGPGSAPRRSAGLGRIPAGRPTGRPSGMPTTTFWASSCRRSPVSRSATTLSSAPSAPWRWPRPSDAG